MILSQRVSQRKTKTKTKTPQMLSGNVRGSKLTFSTRLAWYVLRGAKVKISKKQASTHKINDTALRAQLVCLYSLNGFRRAS